MTTKPDPGPAADDDNGDDTEPAILDTASYIAKSIQGEIDPAEWDAI